MIVFFAIVFIVGFCMVALDFAAWANDPTPSMYHTGLTQWGCIIMIVGAVGALCVLPSLLGTAA